MSCERAGDSLGALCLGALEGAEAAEVERHVSACPACRAELAHARQALALAVGPAKPLSDKSAPADRSDGLTARIIQAGRAELAREKARSRRRMLFAALLTGAAAAGLLLAGTLALRGPASEDCGGCWRFVEGDAGNCRRAEGPATPAPQNVLWEQALPDKAYAYKPLAWKGLVIVGARAVKSGGRLLALSSADGRVTWQREFDSGDFYKAKGFPDRCVLNGRLYVTDGSRCLAFDAASGRDFAAFDPPAEARGWSYLAADGARLYGASRDGRTVFCVDAVTGAKVWTQPAGGAAFVPALAGGRLFLQTGTGTLAALDATTGAELWRREAGSGVPAGRASLHVRGGTGLVLAESGEVLAFSAENGGTAWQRRVPGAFASGLAVGDDAAYLLGGSLALALADGTVVWQREDGSAVCGAPVAAGGEMLAAAGAGSNRLSTFDRFGKLLATLPNPIARPCEGTIVARGRVYTFGNGSLLAIGGRPRG